MFLIKKRQVDPILIIFTIRSSFPEFWGFWRAIFSTSTLELFVRNFYGQSLPKPYLRKKKLSSFRKHEHGIFISCLRHQLSGQFSKTSICHFYTMDLWTATFFKLTLGSDRSELCFWTIDFKNHPDSVILQKCQSLSNQRFNYNQAHILQAHIPLLNLTPNPFPLTLQKVNAYLVLGLLVLNCECKHV